MSSKPLLLATRGGFAVVICLTSLLCATANGDDTLRQNVLAALDFTRSDLARVKTLADSGAFDAAIEGWRDSVVRRLRSSDLGRFDHHDYQISAEALQAANMLMGMPPPKASSGADGNGFVDLYGMHLPSGSVQPISWDATDPDPIIRERSAYGTFGFSVPLIAAFYRSHDEAYARKWLAITTDFAMRQKSLIEQIPPTDRRLENAPWMRHALSCLHQADRTIVIIRCLAALAKSPAAADSGQPPPWSRALQRTAPDAMPGGNKLIPADQLATIALSLTRDHVPLLMEAYLRPGELPNQRLNGLLALLYVSHLFPEFEDMTAVRKQAGEALESYLATAFHADGGMLEQSLNYNLGDLEKLRQIRQLVAVDPPPWLPLLTNRIQGFLLMLEAIRTPAGELPIIGNNDSNPPALWTGAAVRESWFTRKTKENPQGGRPSLAPASCAFPFSGYYAQRSGGDWDDKYLFFTNARPATGHHSMDNLAIEVHAFGRPLLVRGGPPFYSPKFLAPDLRRDERLIEEYIGEGSSFKLNSVIVDGLPQCRSGAPAEVAYEAPITARWHSSEEFDYVEGRYDLGYGVAKPGAIAQGDRSVSHFRRVFFVRRLGVWLISDTMAATDERLHSYSRIWKFPPRFDGPASGHTPAFGFRDEDVVIDKRGIHTADPSGPNLWIIEAGSAPLARQKLFGQRQPYRGWHARYLGDLIPAVDVHSGWMATGTSTQLAVLWPRPDAKPPPIIRTSQPQLSEDDTAAATTLTLTGNAWISFADGGGGVVSDSVPGLTCTARAFVAVSHASEDIHGLVMDGQLVEKHSGRTHETPSGSFEFQARRGSIVMVQPIRRTETFSWRAGPKGLTTHVTSPQAPPAH